MFLELHKKFYGHSTTFSNCYQQHHLQVTGVTIQKCGLPCQDKNDHQIIITHYLLFFSYQQGHILVRKILSFPYYTMKTVCTTEDKDNHICCPLF